MAATIRTDRYEVMQNHSALDGINTVLFNDLKPMPPWEFKESSQVQRSVRRRQAIGWTSQTS